MKNFFVRGGHKLHGSVKVNGSKNAALPIMCAALLTREEVILKNVPDIEDVHSMIAIFQNIGVSIEFNRGTLRIKADKVNCSSIPKEIVNRMRASILVLGAMLHRCSKIKMSFPGGCVLGKRSIDSHTHVFKELGAKVSVESDGIEIKTEKLRGKRIVLPELSVTATENAVMAASLAEGRTEIRLAALEPHVQDLCKFLRKMGAKIEGIGTNTLIVEGVKKLKGCSYSVTGDYLEAGTFAIAAVATNGQIDIQGIDPDHLDIFWQKLEEIGASIELSKNSVKVSAPKSGKLKAISQLKTAVYPGFPTDLQAPFAVLLTRAQGVSKVFETLFEGRLNYLFELEKMGAHVEYLNPHQALILGPTELKATHISSCDIRAGAAMVIAALMAKGETEISNIRYIDRGYQKLDERFNSLGADIQRINE